MAIKKTPLPKTTLNNARELRMYQTNAEKLLWSYLRNRQFLNLKFRRQHPVPPYIADFFCEECSLIIEIDGSQHTPEKDQARNSFLENKGYKVLHIWNKDVVENIEGTLQTIAIEIPSAPSPHPLPEGEGKKEAAHG